MVEISVNVTSILLGPELRDSACLLHQPSPRKMQVNDEGLLGKKGYFWFCGFLTDQSWNGTFHEFAGV